VKCKKYGAVAVYAVLFLISQESKTMKKDQVRWRQTIQDRHNLHFAMSNFPANTFQRKGLAAAGRYAQQAPAEATCSPPESRRLLPIKII